MMFKELLIISLLFILLSSCKKEEPVPTSYSNEYWIVEHYAYFKGTVSDSATGLPITGYNIQVSGPEPNSDTLTDGTYSLYFFWFEGKMSYSKPSILAVRLLDSTNNFIETMFFDGTTLIENDTITVDFQVSL